MTHAVAHLLLRSMQLNASILQSQKDAPWVVAMALRTAAVSIPFQPPYFTLSCSCHNIHVNKLLGCGGEYKALCCKGNITLPGSYGGALICGASFCGLSLVILVSLSHTKQNTSNLTACPEHMNARVVNNGHKQIHLGKSLAIWHLTEITAAFKSEAAASAMLLGILHKVLPFYYIMCKQDITYCLTSDWEGSTGVY
jgi:hypothetical protein